MSKEKKFTAKFTSPQHSTLSNAQFGLLDKAQTITLFESPVDVTTFCATVEDDMFVCCRGNEEVSILTSTGEIKGQWNCEIPIQDISVSLNDQIVYMCCYGDRTIRKLPFSGPFTEVMFYTRRSPLCLCVLQSSNIAVGEENAIRVYDQYGILLTENKSVHNPLRLRECPITGNLAVADCPNTNSEDNYSEVPCVVILNEQLHINHRYIRDKKVFRPCDVAFDSAGNVLIADMGYMDIIMVTQRGKFLGTVYRMSGPTDPLVHIGIQLDNTLWTRIKDDTIRLLKFKE